MNFTKPPVFGVLGSGSWGTALVKILSEHNIKIRWWFRNTDEAEFVKQQQYNRKYLSDVKIIKSRVRPSSKIKRVIIESDIIVLAIPSAFIEEAFQDIDKEIWSNKVVITAVKGLIPSNNDLITNYFKEYFKVPLMNQVVLSGPCHAEEVALERFSYLTVASENEELSTFISKHINTKFIGTTLSTDIEGIEYAAILKNIIAIGCGICHGLNYGDNFLAVLIANAKEEIDQFLNKIAPRERNTDQSAYLGDLLVTTYSQFSRNRTFGSMVGRGYSVKAAQIEMNMVAEGYYALKSIHEIVEDRKLELPIIKSVYEIVYNNKSAYTVFDQLKFQLK